ncbi:PREDICTED: tapasin-related protein [Nanorana parkeri]|uniref:tapasin-related protein n=1 Tax=Nanorana parkeri TaxID=125878 RepID=UPI000854438F|nr:PREDICTED: tapasin-related protein [Nanorana parkeri]
MKTIGLLGLTLSILGPLIQCAAVPHVQRPVDVLLPCEYVMLEQGAAGLSFTRQKVTLVLRNLMVTQEQQSEPLPDYQTPEDTEVPIFEATANLPLLPFVERLLHVECEGEEIVCEITPLYSKFYIAHIRLPEMNIALVAKAGSAVDPDQPLSEKSIIPLTADLLVSSSPPSQRASVSKEAKFTCEVWGDIKGVDIEWHLQRDGKGKKIDPEEDSHFSVEKQAQERKEDSSLTINQLTVNYEGTYICAVSLGPHRLQQILQMKIKEPPQVTLALIEEPVPTLICHTDRYYPLDVEVEWQLNGAPLKHANSVTSSHRRNSDGTYNLNSRLQVSIPQSGAPPDVYSCVVSHVTAEEPIQVDITVSAPEPSLLFQIICYTSSLVLLAFMLKAIHMFARTIPHGIDKDKKLS